MDLLSAIRPQAALFLGKCGGLKKKNHIGEGGHSAPEGDPARGTPHRLHHEHAAVGICGGAEGINRVGYDRAGGIVTKSDLGSAQVVIDRFWHADERNIFGEGLQTTEGAVASRNEETFERDLDDDAEILRELLALAHKVGGRLREDGYRVVLVNSNPATIMTDPDMADATYIEPITWQVVERIIDKERPDAILPTMGGQTALNCALDLWRNGVLDKYTCELIGATPEAIDKAEDRQKFKEAMTKIGLGSARSGIAHKNQPGFAEVFDGMRGK